MSGATVVIADDHRMFREGLRNILEAEGFTVTGEAGDIPTAVEVVEALQPAIALTDAQMPGGSPSDFVAALHAVAPHTHVVMLTMFADPTLAAELEVIGISGFLVKTINRQELGATLRTVLAGAEFMRLAPPSPAEQPEEIDTLTTRETQVLRLLARGHCTREIGEHLGISEATTRRHLTHVYNKLHVRSRVEAVAVALRQGLVPRLR